MSSASRRIRPLVAGSVPATTAMKVDLPAPHGPMRPVICPRGTSSETTATSCMPSKCRWTSVDTSIGCSGGMDSLRQLDVRPSVEDASRFGTHALGSEPKETQDAQADHDPLERRDQVGRSEVQVDHQSGHLLDRKSTRLNSSHRCNSYAVSC